MTVFNTNNVDHSKEYMFFGQPLNVARYDKMRYKKLDDFTEQQLSFFWRPERIALDKDSHDFKYKLTDKDRRIFIANLQYQTLLDSVQGRSPTEVFGPICSLPELETWLTTWAFSECLAEGTEVLTGSGWKDLGDTTTNDECLVYNLDNGEVFFEKPKRVVEYDMDTKLIEYYSGIGKQFNQLVTPNHRMPVVHRDKRKDGTQKRYFNEAINQDYKSHHLAPISGTLKTECSSVLSSADRLMIAAQADGTFNSDRYTGERCGTVPVWFSFKKQRKIDRLVDLCNRAKFELVQLSDDLDGQKRFKVNFPGERFSSIDFKKFDSWVKLDRVNYEWCVDFLEELSHWDSHSYPNSKSKTFTYYTVDKSNADIVQAISSMCGKSPRMTIKKDSRKESYKDVYEINVIDKSFKDGQSIKRRYVDYKGKVRCLETSTGAFVIRYNGVVSVTGNTIHSRSYMHIIRNVFDNPSIIFDEIMLNENILKRAKMVGQYYDELEQLTIEGRSNGWNPNSLRRAKEALFDCMFSTYALEAVRFYVSFACAYSFMERKMMDGNGKIIQEINRDEWGHTGAVHFILTRWLLGLDDPEMTEIAKERLQSGKLVSIMQEVEKQECEWVDYLMQDGEVPLLNKTLLKQYVNFLCKRALDDLRVEQDVFTVSKLPIPWVEKYTDSASVQVAPQETEVNTYLTDATTAVVDFSNLDVYDDL